MLELNRAALSFPNNPIHAAYRLKASTLDVGAQIASFTDSLRHNVSAPWSLYGEVYVSEPEGHETSDRWFLFEMHGTPHEAKTYPAESDVPTQAIHSALGLSEDATLECLGVWQMPSVAP